MQEEKSVNILLPVRSMGIWLVKWVQSTLRNFCQRYTFSSFHVRSSWISWAEFIFRLFLFQHLEQFIKARIPSITSLINKSIDELEAELDHLGRPVAVDAGVSFNCYVLLLLLIERFSFISVTELVYFRLNSILFWNFAVLLIRYLRSI